MSIEESIIEEDLCEDMCEYPMNNLHVWAQDGWEFRISPTYIDTGIFYFKLYNNMVIENATKQSRISLLSPEYIIPSSHHKEIWVLDDTEKEKLIKILNTEFHVADSAYKINNIYDYIKYMYIEQRYGMHGLRVPKKLTEATIPDYSLL